MKRQSYSCKITGCKDSADWLAWFDGCGGLYTYYCTHHALAAIKDGVNGYGVSCLRSIEDAIYRYQHLDSVEDRGIIKGSR